MCERLLYKRPHSVCLPRGQDVVIRSIVLEHHPHTLDVVTGMSPIALGINVTKVQALIQPLTNASDGNGDLARDEGGTSAGRLVVEKNAIGQVHTIGLAVVDQNPEGILLRHGIGRTGVKGCSFRLGDLLDFSVKLRRRRLVETGGLLKAAGADGIEHAQDTDAVAVSSVLGHVERNLNVRHGAQIVDFVGLDIGNDGDEVGGITQVAVVEEKLDSGLVAITVDVIDTARVEGGGTANDAMYRVALGQ
mmetsp:Transcript_21097/g.50915  ORF Transcript_21097/g.50915 Transcript_21097/m.50915 type:complete len:248 (+) Transcript_21097:397-1140(+)